MPHNFVVSYLEVYYEVKRSIKARGHAFSSVGRAWDLCLTEKLVILTADQNLMLNKRADCWKPVDTKENTFLYISLFSPKKKDSPDTTIK